MAMDKAAVHTGVFSSKRARLMRISYVRCEKRKKTGNTSIITGHIKPQVWACSKEKLHVFKNLKIPRKYPFANLHGALLIFKFYEMIMLPLI